MNSKISRKEIQETIEVSLNTAFERLKISDPSKRIRKIAKKASQKLSNEVKSELKKMSKKAAKTQESGKKKSDRKKISMDVPA